MDGKCFVSTRLRALVIVGVVLVIAGLALKARARDELRGSVEMEKQDLRYGFRYDPMKFVENDRSLQGAMVRTFVFHRPQEGDSEVLQKKVDEILAGQFDDGTLSDDEQHRMQFTAEKLIELAELGCNPKRPEVRRGIDVLLNNPSDEGTDVLGIYAVRAMCMFGATDSPKVVAGLKHCAENEGEWNGPDKGCPWTPIEHLITLWSGRELYDAKPLVAESLDWIASGLNDAGCLSYKDPWGFVKMAGTMEHPLASRIVQKEVPMLLRAQKPDGGWGNQSFRAFRALVNHGLLNPLQDRPPLPPDWEVVRSVPAPEGDLFTMTWDGQQLWVKDGKANEAIAVSPEDGKVLKKVKLPVEKIKGIGWWGDALAVTQSEPKRLLKVDADSGEILQEIALNEMDEVLGVAKADGKLVVGDGFMCSARIIDEADPDERRWQTLGGPGPISLAAQGDAVWHFDFWAPAIIKSDLKGRLLDWGEKPFDGAIRGLAWDGEQLWALDAKAKRICVIEKATETVGEKVVIDGLDDYRVIDAMFESTRIVLSYRGEDYSPAYIQGISGGAFRIAGICPCAPTCNNAMGPQELIKLLGYEVEYLPLGGDGVDPEERLKEVLPRVKDEIRSGRPVVLWHAFTNVEWDVVCGFDDENKQLIGRGSYVGCSGEYATADETRTIKCVDICPLAGAILIGGKTGEFDARAAELAALKEAVRHGHSKENEDKLGGDEWVMLEGIRCYDRWITDFKNSEKIRGSGDAYCYGIYRSTHRAASGFLNEIASKYPAASEHLRSAATHFAAEADILDQGEDLLWWNTPQGPDPERNAKAAELLAEARENYSNGISEIKKALEAMDE